jgi:hypothetical protein
LELQSKAWLVQQMSQPGLEMNPGLSIIRHNKLSICEKYALRNRLSLNNERRKHFHFDQVS